MLDGGPQYDTASICRTGHIVADGLGFYPHKDSPFCARCGEKAVKFCGKCDTPIRGGIAGYLLLNAPAYCHHCGAPYPWTEARLEAVRELADELEGLSADERQLLRKSLADVVTETPQKDIAANRIKRLFAKTGKEGIALAKRVLEGSLTKELQERIFL